MSKRRPRQRCTANAADGSRCGRMCAPGEVVCAKHDPNRPPAGVIAQQDTDDPMVLYKRLMRDKDPSIRLRAVNAYIDFLAKSERKCPECAARLEREREHEDLIARATTEQREALLELLKQVKAAKAVILTQPIQPEEPSRAPVIEHPEPPRPRSAVPEPPAVRARVDEAEAGAATVVGDHVAYEVPRDEYDAVGLIVLDGGAITHALGDDIAQQILTGAISLERAKEMHQQAQREARKREP